MRCCRRLPKLTVPGEHLRGARLVVVLPSHVDKVGGATAGTGAAVCPRARAEIQIERKNRRVRIRIYRMMPMPEKIEGKNMPLRGGT